MSEQLDRLKAAMECGPLSTDFIPFRRRLAKAVKSSGVKGSLFCAQKLNDLNCEEARFLDPVMDAFEEMRAVDPKTNDQFREVAGNAFRIMIKEVLGDVDADSVMDFYLEKRKHVSLNPKKGDTVMIPYHDGDQRFIGKTGLVISDPSPTPPYWIEVEVKGLGSEMVRGSEVRIVNEI